MSRITYNKLIRDRIPEIIEDDGKRYEVEEMPSPDYRKALVEKLVEEAQEAFDATVHNPDKLAVELSDLYEVIDAVTVAYELDKDQVQQLQRQRHEERGGFARSLKLLWVEDTD